MKEKEKHSEIEGSCMILPAIKYIYIFRERTAGVRNGHVKLVDKERHCKSQTEALKAAENGRTFSLEYPEITG